MEIAKDSLEIKRKVIERYTEKGLYPYSKYYLRHVHERYDCFWKNHFSTIGINGMNECCLNFLGVPITHSDGIEFAQKTMLFMRDILTEFQEETGNIYNLEATPAESTSYRFALLDTAAYPDIIVANRKEFEKEHNLITRIPPIYRYILRKTCTKHSNNRISFKPFIPEEPSSTFLPGNTGLPPKPLKT